jgi:PIN domain nuclease of toxin-antitoxin system
MKILFDSHAFVWFLLGDRRLPPRLRESLEVPETEFVISAACVWEIATKVRRGRWPEAEAVMANLDLVLSTRACIPLAISVEHARTAGFFNWRHHDPFDRILAAQSQIEAIPLVTADPVFRAFGVSVIW